MKYAVCGALALAFFCSPVKAQDPLTEEKLKGVLATLRQLNKLPAPTPPGRVVRSPKPPQQSVSPEVIKEIGDASLEFLQKYSEGHVIYGGDNRKSYDTATDVEQRAADATAVFVRAGQVSPDRNGTVRLAGAGGPRFCSPRELQPGQQPEPFWEQPRPGFCTGFKVGPDSRRHRRALHQAQLRKRTGRHQLRRPPIGLRVPQDQGANRRRSRHSPSQRLPVRRCRGRASEYGRLAHHPRRPAHQMLRK